MYWAENDVNIFGISPTQCSLSNLGYICVLFVLSSNKSYSAILLQSCTNGFLGDFTRFFAITVLENFRKEKQKSYEVVRTFLHQLVNV